MGKVALPELKRFNYSGALATGSLAAGGVLGILIPPSVVLIIYAIIVEANIVTMFAAAMIPGILAVILFILTIAIYVAIKPEAGPRHEGVDFAEFRERDDRHDPGYGDFRPRARRHIWRLLQSDPGRRRGRGARLDLRCVQAHDRHSRTDREALKETAGTTGMIYLILLGAELMKIFMSRIGLPQATAEWMANSGMAPMMVLHPPADRPDRCSAA
jgi:TRAP-type C4-dicarboxylate transport system permease large subunit